MTDDTYMLRRGSLVTTNALHLFEQLPNACVDLLFADPPYFLSNGGTTCSGGERVDVDKGGWDKPPKEGLFEWNFAWINAARRILKPTGSIIVSGTLHNIFDVGHAIQVAGYRVLNSIIWEKPAPPPNLGCRSLTHSHETIIWASLGPKAKHFFAYEDMKQYNDDKQLKDIWRIGRPKAEETTHGKHPTQKPLELMTRIVEMACPVDGLVVDPFCGSGTTGVAALNRGRRFVGGDTDRGWVAVAAKRLKEAEWKRSKP